MDRRILKANSLLVLASIIWGTTFVAQKAGMEHIGPFLFTGVRFAIGAVLLAPFALRRRGVFLGNVTARTERRKLLWGSVFAGVVLFAAMNLQQIGLVYTTAGKAAFITGLYVVIVPFLGLFWGGRPGFGLWIGAPLAATGLYLLSVKEGLDLAPGDGWVLLCAFAWAAQVLFLGWLSPRMDSLLLAFFQATVCAVLSFVTACVFEDVSCASLIKAWIPILYGGVLSVAVAFTLQVMGQKDASPAHAAIIMQLEAVVGAVSGWILLGEIMGARALVGATIMLTGMLVAQYRSV